MLFIYLSIDYITVADFHFKMTSSSTQSKKTYISNPGDFSEILRF